MHGQQNIKILHYVNVILGIEKSPLLYSCSSFEQQGIASSWIRISVQLIASSSFSGLFFLHWPNDVINVKVDSLILQSQIGPLFQASEEKSGVEWGALME